MKVLWTKEKINAFLNNSKTENTIKHREFEDARILHQRLEEVRKDPIGSTVSWRSVRGTED